MILISFGTRPEWIKIKPLLEKMKGRIPYRLLFTGQHEDLLANLKVDTDLVSLKIQNGPNRLDSIVSSSMNLEKAFDDITGVMVQGDTTSAFSIALAAFHREIKVVHLEAGLRTYDKRQPFPEEFNRQAISKIADVHLCPTKMSMDFLKKERVQGRIEVVGNTVLDNLIDIETRYDNIVVVTMHRRENHSNLDEWFKQIDALAINNKNLDFVIPLHPNPNVQKHRHLLKNLKILKPMEYNEFISLLAKSRIVITDSGGLQEESSFLKKKCIVCRQKTERLEGLGTFSFMCERPERLKEVFAEVDKDHIPYGQCPYGSGYAAENVYKVLKSEF